MDSTAEKLRCGSGGLGDIRGEIDAIDDKIASLFLTRMALVSDVVKAKRREGISSTDPARERQIVSRVTEGVPPEDAKALKTLFSTVFSISKARQRPLLNGEGATVTSIRRALSGQTRFPLRAAVAVAGVEGSYAQQAASKVFEIPEIKFYRQFEEVFKAVENGETRYGVLPIENSAAGSVIPVYDLMQRHRFHIARAVQLKVEHCLLVPRGTHPEDVREVYSHPHAIAQCSGFFRMHPGIAAVPASNTATAAKELSAAPEPGRAVIASRSCAALYGLDIAVPGLQDSAFNHTRFIVISKDLEIYPGSDRISVMMCLPHRPGALSDVMEKFSAIGVNLTKLESRPVPGTDFEFRFIFDFDADASDESVLGLLDELSSDPETAGFVFLGAYSEK